MSVQVKMAHWKLSKGNGDIMSMEQFINALIDREDEDDDDYYYDDDVAENMPCDNSGFCVGTSCPAWWRCEGK